MVFSIFIAIIISQCNTILQYSIEIYWNTNVLQPRFAEQLKALAISAHALESKDTLNKVFKRFFQSIQREVCLKKETEMKQADVNFFKK